MPQPPHFVQTPDAAVGLQCPYCHTPLGAGEAAAMCGDCGTGLHQECWVENQGCAVPGCESGPDPLAAATSAPPAGVAGAAAGTLAPPGRISIPVEDSPRRGGLGRRSAPQTTTPAGLPPQPKRSRRGLVVGGVIVLLIAAAVGVLLSGGSPAGRTVGQLECDSRPGSCTSLTVNGDPHSLSQEDVEQQVQDLVRAYYGALAEGTEEGRARARTMLWGSEQTRLESSEAADQQWQNEAALIGEKLLDPEKARVTLKNKIISSRRQGVAHVVVTGMGWADTTCPNLSFSGHTWAKHEGDPVTGSWRLDPDPGDRIAGGKLKAADVLGARCLGTSE